MGRKTSKFQRAVEPLKNAASGWTDDNALTLSAALAYYTVFSIAPMLIIAIAVAGLFFGAEASRGDIFSSLQGLLGDQGAKGIEALIQGAASKPKTGILASVLGVVTLLFGASGVFTQIQTSLNLIWKVRPKPGRGIWVAVRQRFLSFSMIIVIAFILLVSLVVSAVLTAMGTYFSHLLPGGAAVWQVVNFAVSFGVVSLLFAMIYKILPDVQLAWRDTLTGAVATAFLFTVGKFAIGAYLGQSGAASAYGAAGSIIVLLLWVYYSSCILFFGAEFTRAYATRNGRKIRAAKDAELVDPQPVNVNQRQPKEA